MWGKIATEKEVRDVLIEKVRFEQIFEKGMKVSGRRAPRRENSLSKDSA